MKRNFIKHKIPSQNFEINSHDLTFTYLKMLLGSLFYTITYVTLFCYKNSIDARNFYIYWLPKNLMAMPSSCHQAMSSSLSATLLSLFISVVGFSNWDIIIHKRIIWGAVLQLETAHVSFVIYWHPDVNKYIGATSFCLLFVEMST